MQTIFKKIALLFSLCLLCACAPSTATPTIQADDASASLNSLQLADDYPLYTMRYYGDYAARETSFLPAVKETSSTSAWACSLFAVLLDEEHLLYGRNFDWQFSPALLLFTDPSDGYASVSMVDIAYLGFDDQSVFDLTSLPLDEREPLLDAPFLPFDGMNEYGLAIGMAAVPPGDMRADPSKETIGSLGVMREILDHARDVDEAVAIIQRYNVDFEGGPPLHYLIADAKGKSVLVEFFRGEMKLIENEEPWHLATNFLRSDPQAEYCPRYEKIEARLAETQGALDAQSAMDMLADVSQPGTQWSVVYNMALKEISVVMGKDYDRVLTFKMDDWR